MTEASWGDRIWGDRIWGDRMVCRVTARRTAGAVLSGLMLVCATTFASAEQTKAAGDEAAKAVGSGWSAEVSQDGGKGVSLDDAQAATVEKVSKYFNNLKSLKGAFIQTGADQKVMKGKFMMQQPGKFRFDYARPSRQIIISDGEYLAIQDLDLNNEDRVALDQTPFRILLRNDVNLLRDAQIVEVQETDSEILLAMRDRDPDAPGLIKLVLETKPDMVLKEWVTTDAQGLDTRVQIGNLVRDEKLDADNFVIRSVSKPFNQ